MNPEPISVLKEFIKNKKVVFVGIGNTLRGDDGIGCYFVEELSKKIKNDKISFINAGLCVENYLSKIVKLNPEVVIFVDAYRGEVEQPYLLLNKDEIQNLTFSTHNISLVIIIEFLEKDLTDTQFYILAIKPQSLKIQERISEETKKLVDTMIEGVL
jgi:hydrogenase 3 maturation protease